MNLIQFWKLYEKYDQKLIKRYRGIALLYISGMKQKDIAILEKVTKQRINSIIKTIERKFIKWKVESNSQQK